MDFGAETLTAFRKAPHVGEVILSNDEEKITNMFKMLDDVVEERKKLFIDYNGSYEFYINHGGRQIPTIIVAINNVEAFIETYEEYEERIGQLTRDCLKYGIIFLFSTNGANTVRYRLRQNFSQNVVLQFNDASDYGTVLSGVRKKQPSKIYGRGLIAIENGIYEFQTAYAYKEEKIADYIKVVCDKLSNFFGDERAKRIPILPEVVSRNYVSSMLGNLKTLPVGVYRDTLEVATINLQNNYMYLVTGDDVSQDQSFLKGIISNVQATNSRIVVLDSLSIIKGLNSEDIIYDEDTCLDGFEKIKNIYNSKITKQDDVMTVCVITGIKQLVNKFPADIKTKFTTLITEAQKTKTIKFIVVDTVDSIKQLAYEVWLKPSLDLSSAIWLGNGLSNQFTLKVTTSSRLLRQELKEGFGYILIKGKAYVIKLMSDE